MFDSVKECNLTVSDIEGKVPAELIGTLFRNGPGKRDFSESFFDGDGMIRALRFLPNGQVNYQAKFVETKSQSFGPEIVQNNMAHTPDLRGVFIRGVNGDRKDKRGEADGSLGRLSGSYQKDGIASHQHQHNWGFRQQTAKSQGWGTAVHHVIDPILTVSLTPLGGFFATESLNVASMQALWTFRH